MVFQAQRFKNLEWDAKKKYLSIAGLVGTSYCFLNFLSNSTVDIKRHLFFFIPSNFAYS